METAEVSAKPAIPVRNLWYLLVYAWDLAAWRGRWDGVVEKSPTLLGLLARVLQDSTQQLLRHQLGRAFTRREDIVQGVRGRIRIGASIQRLQFYAGKATCVYPELSVDSLKNRILRSSLHSLARDPRVDHAYPEKAKALRRELGDLEREMEGVALVPLTNFLFSQVRLGRNDREYEVPLSICRLLQRLELPTEEEGNRGLVALLHDEISRSRLFEQFLRNFWRYHLSDYAVDAERLSWRDELKSDLVPTMLTDVSLVRAGRRLIVDAKYYSQVLSSHHETEKFRSENLYQLYAYLRTQEDLSPDHKNADGMLLYGKTAHEDRNLDEMMHLQGHRVRVVTLDLGQPWEDIEARLKLLVDAGWDRTASTVASAQSADASGP